MGKRNAAGGTREKSPVFRINSDISRPAPQMIAQFAKIPAALLVPMKVASDSDLIPVTGSEVKLIVFGAKRRWRSHPA